MAREPAQETRTLRACIRDLVALSALPACWVGRPTEDVVDDVRELLAQLLELEVMRIDLRDPETHKGLAPKGRAGAAGSRAPEAGEAVGLHFATFALGLDGELGGITVGARRPGFPGEMDALLLQLAANQIAVALQQAALLRRRERAERNLSEFLGMISHELRTPLNAISGYVEILEMGLHGPVTEQQQGDLKRIRQSYNYLLGLLNNVLTFLKVGSGQLRFEITAVALEEVLETVETVIQPLVEARHLRFERPGRASTGTRVWADPEKLQQIVLNLLSNATKFTEPGGSVRLLCSQDRTTVRVRVEDSGCGIPPERLESVFEPFVQVHDRAGRNEQGIGLGLPISREFARAMGGDLLAESEPGKGSAFTVVLPRDAQRAPKPSLEAAG